ncbi:uncharacterized protein LOC135126394 [Zophobas morio]|uniref:uncharacterized protein LOC135126394 n=1 Tax=Zophobas morio TaxID=2755281 RepID=UPI0030829DC7
MSDQTNLLFHIVYNEQECSFQLFKYKTVTDLKNEIFKKFGIAPYKQVIECWHEPPSTDANTLITCCLLNDCNFLVVYNIEDNFQDNYVSSEINLPSQANDSSRSISEETETSSILSFIQYFSSHFTTRGITFRISCLDDAFEQAFSRKEILLLYLHNRSDPFAQIFCEQLTKPDVQRILSNKFYLLCWDIDNNNYKNILIEALHKHEELSSFDNFIELKICSVLLVAPVGDTFTIISIMKETLSPQEILSTLQNAESFVNNVNTTQETLSNNQENTGGSNGGSSNAQEDPRHALGSKEYQQLMLDMLGDRDYDSFDYYEFEYLKEKIGYALNGPPKKEEGYEEKEKEKIGFLFKKILNESNLIAKWQDRVIISFIYVCTEPLPEEKAQRAKKYSDYDPYTDLTPFPVFVLRKCKNCKNPCRIFIDDVGRVYDSWNGYLANNKLPKCRMIFPKNGRYEADGNGDVILGEQMSPVCGVQNRILEGADIASAVGGIASGGVMVAATSISAVATAPLVLPLAGAAGLAVGAYSLGRSAYALYDRHVHKESLSFFESPEARGAYINIVAGSLGFAGAGANVAVSALAAEGYTIGTGARAAVNTLNIVNLGAGGAGVVNASYDVIRNWWYENQPPSLLTIVQLSSSVLFFGHAVYNYRSVNTVIEESQVNTLRDYQDSLRSNRHRKTLTKLVKETIRQNDGNVQRGRAEVISTIKNIQNKDEVFATLTRSNRAMNRNNVRFAASDGGITLNGVHVDMTHFTNMEKNEVITFLTKLPNQPKPADSDIRNMSTTVKNSFQGVGASEIFNLSIGLVKLFGSTELTIKEKIISAVSELIKALIGNPEGYMDTLDRIFPNHHKYFRLVGMVNSFFQQLINEEEQKYTKWFQTRNPDDEKPYFFGFLSLDAAKRVTEIFNIVTKAYFIGTHLTQFGLEKLLEYFYTWFTRQVYSFEEREQRRQRRTEHGRSTSKYNCTMCGGYYYARRE